MEREIDIEGRAVGYVDIGSGPALVLLHAFPLSANLWEPQFELAGDHLRIVAPDLRGFGRSSRTASRVGGEAVAEPALTVEAHARDVLRLLDVLEIDRAVIGGLSMGGYVSFALQRLAPERVRALVLADTRAEADTAEGRRNREVMLAALAKTGPRAVADAMVPKLLGPATRRERPALEEEVRRAIEAASPDGMADAIHCLMERPDVSASLPSIAVPVLLVVGRDDELTPVALHERMLSLLPDASLTVIESAGHLSSLERPDVFNRSVSRFLRMLP